MSSNILIGKNLEGKKEYVQPLIFDETMDKPSDFLKKAIDLGASLKTKFNGGFYSMPQLIQILVDTGFDNGIWARDLMTNSAESLIYNPEKAIETYREIERGQTIPLEDAVLITHGDSIFARTPHWIDISSDKKGIAPGYFGNTHQSDLVRFLQGKLGQNEEVIPVFEYEQFLKESSQPDFHEKFPGYGIILSGEQLRDDKNLLAARIGSPKLAEAYLNKIKSLSKDGKKVKVDHIFCGETKKIEVDPTRFVNQHSYSAVPKPYWQIGNNGMPVIVDCNTDYTLGTGWVKSPAGYIRGFTEQDMTYSQAAFAIGNFDPFERHERLEKTRERMQNMFTLKRKK